MPLLNRDLALNAYRGISMTPEARADADEASVVAFLAALRQRLAPLAQSDVQRALLDAELARFCTGYVRRYHAVLAARARTMSTLITGRANFPVARNAKRLATEYRRYQELVAWSERETQAIQAKLLAARTPAQVDAADWDELRRCIAGDMAIVTSIDAGEALSDRRAFTESVAGRLRRHAAQGRLALVARALDYIKERQAGWPKPFFAPRNRVWSLVADTEQAAAIAPPAPTGVEEIAAGSGYQALRNHDEERLQLVFEATPDQALRDHLKATGWRWSPTNRAWQRQITVNAEYALRQVLDRLQTSA